MITFISDCTGLFAEIFTALCGLDFFRFLVCLILVETCLGLWFFFNRGMQRR